MLPEYPAFKPLGPEDHDLVARHLAMAPHATCDLTLANLYIWRECEPASISFVHGNLCIRIASHNELPYFLEPLGEDRILETVEVCLRHTGRISRAGESLARRLPPGSCQVVPIRDHFDYVYDLQSLADLRGKKFDGKRNQIRKFQKTYPGHEFLPLDAGHREAALNLFDRWSSGRDDGNGTGFLEPSANHTCQRRAIERAFDDFSRLNLRGGALFVDGSMEGFILASPGNEGLVTAHLQYANYNMPGIYQVLLWETCRQILAGFTLLNMEEDLGIPGLRKTKLSYQPIRLEEKFLITPVAS